MSGDPSSGVALDPYPSADQAQYLLITSTKCIIRLPVSAYIIYRYIGLGLEDVLINSIRANPKAYVSSLQYPFSEHSGRKWLTSGRFVGTLVTFDGFLPQFLPALSIKWPFNKRWWTMPIALSSVLLDLKERGKKSPQQKTWKINKSKTNS